MKILLALWLFPFLLLFFTDLFCRTTTARDTITPTQPLADGDTLVSSGGAFALGFFSPTNSTTDRYVGIWFNNIRLQTVVWVANRLTPINSTSGVLSLTPKGKLVITYNSTTMNIIIWSSAAETPNSIRSTPVAQLLDSGNLVVTGLGLLAWQSFDHPTDSLLPGMKLGWDLRTGLNRNLTAWRSPTDPAPGNNIAAMDLRGDPELTVFTGAAATRKWRSGPWNGVVLTGIPEMKNYTGFTFTFIDNATDVYYEYDVNDPSIITRLIVNETGTVQRYVWLDEPGAWSLFWYTPKTPCDSFSPCGPYGLCDPNGSPMCSCLTGFEPKSQAAWELRDGSQGCARKTGLDCLTDGFMKVNNAMPPDTARATVDRSMNLDQCRAACMQNCSCTGYTIADVRSGGSGCIMWASEMDDLEFFVNGGQDLYVRLAGADLASMLTSSKSDSNKTRDVVVATISLISATLLLSLIGCYLWRKKKRDKIGPVVGVGPYSAHQQEESYRGDEDLELSLFDLSTLITATDGFAPKNKLGEGGFGPVYKGILQEGEHIAVKRLSKTSIQGTEEFKNEVTLIAKLQHRNLVRLLGGCVQAEEMMLVYEYMHNKSLDIILFDKVNGMNLDWPTRYRIIIGIARGLIYLHHDSRLRIIHRDLKASNILLDKEMNPKISDFGLARIFGCEEAMERTKKVVGTYGYMSPEYAMDGIFSIKSDVFSFGVLVLEIISGKRNKGVYLSNMDLNLLGNAWSLWKEDKIQELVDQTIGYSLSMTEVMRCIKVGLLCVQESPKDRPTMSSVVLMLGRENSSLPEPMQPGFVARKDQYEGNSSSKEHESSSVNSLTFTTPIGR